MVGTKIIFNENCHVRVREICICIFPLNYGMLNMYVAITIVKNFIQVL